MFPDNYGQTQAKTNLREACFSRRAPQKQIIQRPTAQRPSRQYHPPSCQLGANLCSSTCSEKSGPKGHRTETFSGSHRAFPTSLGWRNSLGGLSLVDPRPHASLPLQPHYWPTWPPRICVLDRGYIRAWLHPGRPLAHLISVYTPHRNSRKSPAWGTRAESSM